MDDMSEAAVIETAVEKALQAPVTVTSGVLMSETEKVKKATEIYTTWRNATLVLPTESFNQIEAASGALINAIAAAL